VVPAEIVAGVHVVITMDSAPTQHDAQHAWYRYPSFGQGLKGSVVEHANILTTFTVEGEFRMHILILGAAGMIGRKLTDRLVADGNVGGTAIDRLTLADVVSPQQPANTASEVELVAADLSTPGEADRLVEGRPDVILHLAAIVSSDAEANFDKGYRVNLDGTRALFDAVRAANAADGYQPRLVFTSSNAVYGPPLPNPVPEDYQQVALSSYGIQKSIGELLLADYTRRGFFDGIGIRLPTICIRPGKPNKAASGFFSGILREPLIGQEAVLPVPDTLRHFHASPRSVVNWLVQASALDGERVGPRRTLAMPGLSATVGEQIEALGRVAGEKAVKLIRREPDEAIMAIVGTWAEAVDFTRAARLGFTAESSFDEIIQIHIEDELGGSI
jgi:nucleoside-diphosphate-sugar epimerase